MGNTKVRITVLSGRHLLPMDRWGTSDPYVKVMQGEKCLHRTPEKRRTLSPVWNNQFNIIMENTFTPIVFQVFDKKKLFDFFDKAIMMAKSARERKREIK